MPLRLLLALALTLILAACGGGGGSSSTPQALPPAPGPSAQVTSVTPATALAGDTVTVSGSGLSTVTVLRLAGQSVAFTRVSDTQLRFVVPAGAPSGTLAVEGAGYSVSTSFTLTVAGTPVARTLSASTALPSSNLTVTGANLDSVTSFQLASGSTRSLLTVVSRSDASVTLTLPASPMTGTLVFKVASGTEVDTRQTVRVATAPRITALSPTSALLGGQVTLSGSGLLGVATVRIGTSTEVTVTPTDDTTLVVTVPDSATSGVVQVTGPLGSATGPVNLTVLPTARVTGFQARIDASGMVEVNIAGTNLDVVNAVTIGSTTATVVAKTATALTARVGAGVQGPVVLSFTSGQAALAAGSVVRGNYTLARAEFAQQFAYDASDSQMRLATGRPTLLRVQLVAPGAGVALPTVKARASVGASVLGEVTLTAPSGTEVPTAESQYDLPRSWWTELPVAWVQPGVQVQLSAVNGGTAIALGSPLAPTVGTAPALTLVLVPLRSGAHLAVLPDSEAVRAMVTRAYPHTAGNIVIERHAEFDVTSAGPLDAAGWTAVLNRVNNLRSIEATGTKKAYIGFVPAAARVALNGGIAFLNSLASASAGTAAMSGLVYDGANTAVPKDPFGIGLPQWALVLVHELGHLMSREHAPCNVTPADASYPYAGGRFSTRAVWNPETKYFGAPLEPADPFLPPGSPRPLMADVMGYCNGAYFSDYNLPAVQRFAEAWSIATTGFYTPPVAALVEQGATEAGTMLVSGSITADGVVFYPAVATNTVTLGEEGPYELRLTTTDGRVFSRRFALAMMGDHLPRKTGQFQVPMPLVDDVASIEVLYQGAKVREDTDAKRAQSATAHAATAAATATFEERGGELRVKWSAPSHPNMTVVYVSSTGARTVLAMNRTGGEISLPTAGLPAGGHFEMTVSSERAARRFRLER